MHSKEIAIWGVLLILVSCTKAPGADPSRRPDATYNPQLNVIQFNPGGELNNQFIKHLAGKSYVYSGRGEEGDEQIEIKMSAETVTLHGITCAIMVEEIRVSGYLLEQEESYLAEDIDGTVWALGAAVKNFNASGVFINDHTSWIYGIDGAKPGIVMLSDPQVGMQYRQEYYFNVAENQAEIVETGITVTTVMATFHDCIVVREWSELEPDILEYKMYAPGIGLVKEVNLSTGDEIELVDIR